jgi:endonuclease/exonuclease/phosphatase family metal-dependent hydrolase
MSDPGPSATRTPPAPDLRVATLNLWGVRGEWKERRSVIADGFRELRPDLIAFQEAIVTVEYDQVVDLLGPGFHVAHQQAREPDGQGISIASRWPLDRVHEVDLQVTPRTKNFACATLIAEIRAPDPIGPLVFANHLPNWQLDLEYERELQTVIAARRLEELRGSDGRHVILAGDMDAVPDAASIRFWTGRQSLDGMSVCYRDAWEAANPGKPGDTFTPSNPLVSDWERPFRRIDYVLVRCVEGGPTLAVRSCARIFDQPIDGVWASDHFGVVADLAVPKRASAGS